jgi:hypothetical protein
VEFVIPLVEHPVFVKRPIPVGTQFWKRVKAVMMGILLLVTAVTQAVFWRIPNFVTLLPLAKLVLHLAPVGFVILLVEHLEFVRLLIPVGILFSKLVKVATMETLPVAMIVLLHA